MRNPKKYVKKRFQRKKTRGRLSRLRIFGVHMSTIMTSFVMVAYSPKFFNLFTPSPTRHHLTRFSSDSTVDYLDAYQSSKSDLETLSLHLCSCCSCGHFCWYSLPAFDVLHLTPSSRQIHGNSHHQLHCCPHNVHSNTNYSQSPLYEVPPWS